jgi:hypothetical protein
MDEATKKPKLSFAGVPSVNLTANPASLGGYLATSIKVGQENAVKAELSPPESLARLEFVQQEAVARGLLKNYVSKLDKSNPDTATILEGINGAIRSQDLSSVEAFSPELASVLSIYAKNPKAFGDYNDFSKEYLQGQIAVTKSVSSLAKAESDAAVAADIRKANANTADFATSVYNTASTIQATGSYARDVRSAVTDLRDQSIGETNEDVITSLNDRAKVIETSLVDGLVSTLVRGKTSDDVTRIRQAVADNNYANLTDDERTNFFILMDGISPDMRDHVDTELGAYAAGPAKFAETKQREEAVRTANNVRAELPAFRTLGIDKIAAGLDEVNAAIESIPGLPDGDAKALKDDANIAAATAALNLAVNGASSEADLLKMDTYVRTGEAGDLPQSVLKSLDEFVRIGGNVSDNGFRQSAFNSAEQAKREKFVEARNANASANAIQTVAGGRGNPTTQEGRTAADNWTTNLINRYLSDGGDVPVISPPADLWTNPTYIEGANYTEFREKVFSVVYKTPGAMPSGLLSSLQSLAAGVYNPTTMAHYNAMKTVSTPQGIISNPALNALGEDERGRLEFYSQVLQLTPEANIATLTAAANQNMSKEGFSKTVGMFLGSGEEKPINDWMLESITDYQLLNTAQQESVKSLVTYLVADTLAGGPAQQTPKSIARRINEQMNSWFPDSEGYVIDMSNGLPSSRTKLALSQTIPKYQSEFIQYVQDEVSKTSPNAMATKFAKSPNTGFFGALESTSQAIVYGYGAQIKPFIQLVPRGADRFGGQTYMVTSFNPESGMRNPVVKQNGEPLMVSTAEPGFAAITNKIATEERLLAERQEAAAKELLDLTSGRTPITLGGN